MPLQQPANYGIGLPDIPDPNAALQKSLEFASGLVGAQQKSQLFGLQMQQAQIQQQQQQNLQARLADLSQSPTPNGIAQLMVLHPEMSENLKRVHDTLDASEQRARLGQLSQIHAALLSGEPDIAMSKADELATAYENSNRPQDAQAVRNIGNLILTKPTAAALATGAYIAAQDPSKYSETFSKYATLGDEKRKLAAETTTAEAGAGQAPAQQLAATQLAQANARTATTTADNAPASQSLGLDKIRADIRNIDDEIKQRGNTADLAKQKFTLEKAKNEAEVDELRAKMSTLPPEIAKDVNSNVESAQVARTAATRASNLATLIRQRLSTSGGVAAATEFIKGVLGNEGAETELRQQYNQLLNEATLAQLKGLGRITENEIALIRKGFASATSSPELMARTMDLMSEAQNLQADKSQAKAQWLSENRDLGSARKAFIVGGRAVPPGQTFNAFLDSFAPKAESGAGAKAAASPVVAPKTLSPAALEYKRARLAALDKKAGA